MTIFESETKQIHCEIWKTIFCQVGGILRLFFLQHTTQVNKMEKLSFFFFLNNFTFVDRQCILIHFLNSV